jgi:hypothetical protein
MLSTFDPHSRQFADALEQAIAAVLIKEPWEGRWYDGLIVDEVTSSGEVRVVRGYPFEARVQGDDLRAVSLGCRPGSVPFSPGSWLTSWPT